MLRDAFGGVLGVLLHEGLDVGEGDEGEEFEVSLYVRICGAKEELVPVSVGELEEHGWLIPGIDRTSSSSPSLAR